MCIAKPISLSNYQYPSMLRNGILDGNRTKSEYRFGRSREKWRAPSAEYGLLLSPLHRRSMKENKLKSIEGQKIRRQYFNIFIFMELIISIFTVTPMLVINTLWGDSGTKLNSWSEIFTHIISVAIALMLPFAIISFFNRFLFGKTVCVLNEKGIHYPRGEKIRVRKWEDVDYIEYGIRMWPFFMTDNHKWCFARLIGKNFDDIIDYAPFMIGRKAKKYKPKLKIKLEKSGLKLVALAIAIPFGVSILGGIMGL